MNHEELEQVIYERTRDFVSRRVMDCILELIAEEREACAKVCDDAAERHKEQSDATYWALRDAAFLIRNRGKA